MRVICLQIFASIYQWDTDTAVLLCETQMSRSDCHNHIRVHQNGGTQNGFIAIYGVGNQKICGYMYHRIFSRKSDDSTCCTNNVVMQDTACHFHSNFQGLKTQIELPESADRHQAMGAACVHQCFDWQFSNGKFSQLQSWGGKVYIVYRHSLGLNLFPFFGFRCPQLIINELIISRCPALWANVF